MKRLTWLDMSKGIGLLLVIFGHVQFTPNIMYVWLCSFHMPLFFFLAGVTYHEKKYTNFKTLLKNKIRTLAVPYFIFAILTLVWHFVTELKNVLLSGSINWEYLAKQTAGVLVQI